jgi:predicted nucleic acid-binding protein
MKVVIADASCLILFTNIQRLDVLEKLFGELWITHEVKDEYGLVIPSFIYIQEPIDLGRQQALKLLLDPGEASSIALAAENPGCQIIIDEKKGRRIALALGLDITGTLGVLIEASKRGFIEADSNLLEKLSQCGFRLSPSLKEMLFKDG